MNHIRPSIVRINLRVLLEKKITYIIYSRSNKIDNVAAQDLSLGPPAVPVTDNIDDACYHHENMGSVHEGIHGTVEPIKTKHCGTQLKDA